MAVTTFLSLPSIKFRLLILSFSHLLPFPPSFFVLGFILSLVPLFLNLSTPLLFATTIPTKHFMHRLHRRQAGAAAEDGGRR